MRVIGYLAAAYSSTGTGVAGGSAQPSLIASSLSLVTENGGVSPATILS